MDMQSVSFNHRQRFNGSSSTIEGPLPLPSVRNWGQNPNGGAFCQQSFEVV